MKIVIVDDAPIPTFGYGGVERFVWWLGRELVRRKHDVTFVTGKGSRCNFAPILEFNRALALKDQLKGEYDVVHLQFPPDEELDQPHLVTLHGNYRGRQHINTVFVSRDHARRYNSSTYVHIGLDYDEYGEVDWEIRRQNLLYLAADRPEKNLLGSLEISNELGEKLIACGIDSADRNESGLVCLGNVGGLRKHRIINSAEALLFPVLWHEPFGIAMVESLYFGLPVFGTRYGSLSEIIHSDVGFLSNSRSELREAVRDRSAYSRRRCHEYAVDCFNIKTMTTSYLALYERVANGENLNCTHPERDLAYDPNGRYLPSDKEFSHLDFFD